MSALCKSLLSVKPEYDTLFDTFLKFETKITNIGTGNHVAKVKL